MAKMFYSSDEVLEKLGISQEQLDKLVSEGNLREFRDGAKKMFKVDEVDNFNPIEISGDEDAPSQEDTPTGSSDSGDVIPLVDTGTGLDLAPMDSGSGLGLMPGDTADQIGLDDSTESGEKDDTVITAAGGDEDEESGESPAAGTEGQEEEEMSFSADPLAQTQLTDEDLEDRVSLDSGSSGSGLLDLSREADDTSLGAELLEEIYPSADEGAVETQLPDQMDMAPDEPQAPEEEPEAAPPVAEHQPPVTSKIVVAYDDTSTVFGAAMIIPFLMLIFMAIAAFAAISGVQPGLLSPLIDGENTNMIWYITGGGGGVMILIVVIGLVMMNQSGQPKPKKAKEPKAKKTKTKGKKSRKK